MKQSPIGPARRLLFVRPRFLGDVCLTLPAVDAALAACPGAQAAYVTEAGLAPLLRDDPRFAQVIEVPARPDARATLALVRAMRAFAPDVAFDFFCNPRTALWTRLSGARVRVGYPNKGWRSAMYTHHARPRTLSSVGFHLASVSALGWPVPAGDVSPRLVLADALRREAREALRERVGARWVTDHLCWTGVAGKNTAPEDIARTSVPHTAYLWTAEAKPSRLAALKTRVRTHVDSGKQRLQNRLHS